MKTPSDRAAVLPAMLLVAVVTAVAGTAWANDGFVPPLPATSDGGPRTEDAAGSDSPAGGSRLLRALAERPAAPGPAESGATGAAPVGGPRVFGPRVYAAEGCPRALLRRLLKGAVDEADALTALAIEREALTLCRERQEIVAGLFETEARLAELRAPIEAPVPAAVVAETLVPKTLVPETVVPAPPAAVPGTTAPVSPLRAALGGTAEAAQEDEPRPPSYAWFSIIGTAGALRAGITDGEDVWFVRAGDRLPDGGTVVAIAGRPPGVRLALPGGGAEETLVPETLVPETPLPEMPLPEMPLPFKARPGGGP